MESLKKEFLGLLDRDVEFRYAVASYLGLSEILKKLDGLFEELRKIWKEINKLWEGQNKLWENQNKLWEEVRSLREGQNKLWEEVRSLREGQNKLWEEVRSLREGQNKLWEGQARIERRIDSLERTTASLESAMISGFGELSKFAGLTFEEFVRKFLTAGLRRSGEIPEQAEIVRGTVCGEEINLFLEEPLIVGEVTSYADSAHEILKLLRKAEVARASYAREPRKILVILTAKKETADEIRKLAKENNVKLIIGKEVD